MYQQEGENAFGKWLNRIVTIVLVIIAGLFIYRYFASTEKGNAGEVVEAAEGNGIDCGASADASEGTSIVRNNAEATVEKSDIKSEVTEAKTRARTSVTEVKESAVKISAANTVEAGVKSTAYSGAHEQEQMPVSEPASDYGNGVAVNKEGTQAAHSASSVRHLSFKGVPVDGTLAQFVSRMKAAGFSAYRPRYGRDDTSDSRTATLQGDFAGFKGCIVRVSTLSNLDLVCKIFVQFPGHENWEGVYGDYSQLKSLLTSKYGAPSKCVERFDDHRDDNSSRYYGVVLDHSTYKTTFSPAEGTLILSISHESVSSAFATLEYYDAENMKAEESTALSDL